MYLAKDVTGVCGQILDNYGTAGFATVSKVQKTLKAYDPSLLLIYHTEKYLFTIQNSHRIGTETLKKLVAGSYKGWAPEIVGEDEGNKTMRLVPVTMRLIPGVALLPAQIAPGVVMEEGRSLVDDIAAMVDCLFPWCSRRK